MLLYEKLSGQIINAAIEVHSILGTGLLEKSYERALIHELSIRGLKCINQVPIKLEYKNIDIGQYFADIIVEDKIILELKCVSTLNNEHMAQTIHYVNTTNYNLALLINFGSKKLEFKRILKTTD
ncbi:GxxExxY protein [Alkalicella caledoniensis]|uniref:GxxExxY protein n=1 Tax=Alkalicella caledoniensis TaxID=2731377 RepID=A0A7G9W413_ALKCA|nr:GxxExxY protein [Alkalicella caledoniensis]QNO13425.1 GxxExxY protein [Alkalicella caledoniensis]